MVTRYPGSLGIKIEVQVADENALSLTFPSVFLFVILGFFVVGLNGLGYSTTIAASYGSVEQVCAIEANGEQEVLCWGSNSSGVDYPSSTQLAFSVLSGGNGFMCGLIPDGYTPYCWQGNWTGTNLIPQQYQNNSYATIATGETHFCAITGDKKGDVDGDGGGIVQCWGENEVGEVDVPPDLPTMDSIVAGRSFTCALERYSRRPRCWGSSQYGIESSIPDAAFESLSAGTNHVCGVVQYNKVVQCWGDNSLGQSNPPQNVSFIAVSTGLAHSCGITELSHEVQCWGDQSFDMSTVHTGVGFLVLTSAPNMTCGIREDNLLAMCWGNEAAKTNYSPPLQLFSPGLCSPNSCGSDSFTFHASNVLDVGASRTGNICLDSNSQICAPCASSCPSGLFLSSACGADVDRVCTDCSLCQNDSCQASCVGVSSFPAASPLQGKSSSSGRKSNTAPIIGAAVTGGVLVLVLGALFICFLYRKRFRYRFWGCASRHKLTDSGGGISSGSLPGGSHILTGGGRNGIINGGARNGNHVVTHDIIRMQAFRLAELRDATNGFKEVNELGRGSYGFVYKALLPDGRQVAVKRANAARRIQSRSRDFEAELEVLCKLHHAHLVNLVGYCEEMGERLLVYEFMPHGTLHDHLHGGLAQLNWHLRLKIAAQAARGIEYLHKDASPRIIHRDVKSSNILLDAEWGARVADFGLALPEREKGPPPSMRPCDVAYVDPEYLRTQTYTEKSDVYSFGVVLLEILCGRKAWDSDFKPANIVEWATPFIRNGQSSQILDRSLDLPKNKEPLMRVGEIVELCVRSSPQERPSMTDVASWLELVGRSSSL